MKPREHKTTPARPDTNAQEFGKTEAPRDAMPPPLGLASVEQVGAATRAMLLPPEDLPIWSSALAGLLIQLKALLVWFPAVAALLDTILSSKGAVAVPVPPSQTEWARSHHIGRHPEYYAAIETGERVARGQALRQATLAQLATWSLRLLLEGKRPNPATITAARLRAECGTDETKERLENRAAARALSRSLRDLEHAIRRSPVLAVRYGLTAPHVPPQQTDPIAAFNRSLRTRRAMLMRYAKKQQRAGAGGHGALSCNDLGRGGDELLAALRAGDARAIMASIQVRTELDSSLAELLPVQLGALPPPGAIAWICLIQGTYCALLDQVTRKGQRPHPDTADLYERTTQVIRLALMAPLVHALATHVGAHTGVEWLPLGQLLRVPSHRPREALAGTGPYRSTARKFQRSLGGELLAAGHGRWAAAMTTQQATLVPESHEFYSAIPASMLDAASIDLHRLLNWPVPALAPELVVELIGSHVTLKLDSLPKLFQSLVDAADAASVTRDQKGGIEAVIRSINCHAAFVACVLALCLALRKWGAYELSPQRLSIACEYSFNEKEAHADPEAAVPVVGLVREVCAAWGRFLNLAITDLMAAGDAQSASLAGEIRAMCTRAEGTDRLFVIGQDLMLHPVGHNVWVLSMPKTLRVPGNVFRHFWPLHLLRKGLPQLLIDVLLRHQLGGLHAGTAHIVGVPADRRRALCGAMESILRELPLPLPLPRAFTGGPQ